MQFRDFLNRPGKSRVARSIAKLVTLLILSAQQGYSQTKGTEITNIVFTSDAHYGITRGKFRGDTNVTSSRVNAAMIGQINSLPGFILTADGGVNAGKQVSYIDYIIEGGDIANRMEVPIQSAAASWGQFEADYMHKLNVMASDGKPARLLIIPGNHDISNATGYSKLMQPLTDPTSMVMIYNLMMKPAKPLTNDDYNYATEKINYSYNIKGVHFQFITLWPDSAEREWMQKDLDTVASSTPVIIFTHDQPECESKHFTNPLPPHNMTVKNRFEDLTAEYYKEGAIASKDDGATFIEQRGFVKFLKKHPNIKAYFHGNSNWNQFYKYHGPDNDVNLQVFRVDSPMKGKFSASDETKLSFQLISLDAKNKLLTVRECLWNTVPMDASAKIVIGDTMTISLKTE
jgi:hypothetical protein